MKRLPFHISRKRALMNYSITDNGFIKTILLSVTALVCFSFLQRPNVYAGIHYDLSAQFSTHYPSSLSKVQRLAITGAQFNHLRFKSNEGPQTAAQSTCSDGWYITGYFVPKEDELPDTAEEIYIERQGNLSFSQKFLSETRTEGWG